jgi:hypothetical protein
MISPEKALRAPSRSRDLRGTSEAVRLRSPLSIVPAEILFRLFRRGAASGRRHPKRRPTPSGGPPGRQRRAAANGRVARARMPDPEPEHAPAVTTAEKVAALTAKDCRFPIGDPQREDFKFCGEARVAGKRYCERHCGLAYCAPRDPPAATDRHQSRPTVQRANKRKQESNDNNHGGSGSKPWRCRPR